MLKDLEDHRAFTDKLFIVILWLHVPLNVATCWAFGNNVPAVAGGSFLAAGLASAMWFAAKDKQSVRNTAAICYMITISLLLSSLSGYGWQSDLHMYYFAGLALVALYCDWRVIVAAAATVAVHHLTLNFLIPAAVFPGGASLGRVLLHAFILSCEAAGLIWLSRKLVAMFALASHNSKAADLANALEVALRDAETVRSAEQKNAALQKAAEDLQAEEQRHMVAEIAAGLDGLTKGNLTGRLLEAFPVHYDKIRTDFNAAADGLQDAFRLISSSANGISNGSGQIAQATVDLSRRTTQQAASLEETAAALRLITETIKASVANTGKAAKVVVTTRGAAESSGVIVARAVDAMGEIKGSSQQITNIIGVIDEIAFQTNLLALNAGVEAARAGDAGRGFAVVASEVRALAQRSAEAAKEIKTLISASTAQVESGVNLVHQTGQALKDIITKITDMGDLVTEISSASKDQASGIADVCATVAQMDQVVQQNATIVQESAAAARVLSTETQDLAAMVGRFKIAR